MVKNPPANVGDMRDTGSIPGWGRSLEKEMATTPVFLPGKFHGQKSLAGYSPWGRKRVRPSLMTKQKQHKIQQYLQDNINILNELKIHSSVK